MTPHMQVCACYCMEDRLSDSQTTQPTPDATASDLLTRLERKLKVFDFCMLIVAALLAAKVSEGQTPYKPLFLIGVGAYQVAISAVFLFLVWRKRTLVRPEITLTEEVYVPTNRDNATRLRRWQLISRRLPFQLDYILRVLAGIALIVWGIWITQGN